MFLFPRDEVARVMLGADPHVSLCPTRAELVKDRLEDLLANGFDTRLGQRFFNEAIRHGRVERHERLGDGFSEWREDRILGACGATTGGLRAPQWPMNARGSVSILPLFLSKEENCLTNRYPFAGPISEPGDQSDVLLRVRPLVGRWTSRTRETIAPFPSAERVCWDAGALRDGARVVDWISIQLVEKIYVERSPPGRHYRVVSSELQYPAQQSSGFSAGACGVHFFTRGGESQRAWGVLPTLVTVFLLAACGDDAEQRRFVTDEQPVFTAASPTVGPTATVRPTPTMSLPPLSPEALLTGTEAPATVYLARDNEIWVVDPREDMSTLVFTGGAGEPPVFAADPDGERVAVLGRTTERPSGLTLLVLENGSVKHRVERIEETFAETARDLVPVSLDWSADGQRLLAGFRGGGLLEVPLSGKPSVILNLERVPYLVSARWSPDADAIAYIARDSVDGAGRLFVAKLRGGATDPVVIAPKRGTPGQSVESLAWRPGAGTILYLQSSTAAGTQGHDLFEIAPSGQERRLVASAGRVAPVASIAEFDVSPDGQSVAYSVYVPGAEGPRFDSLWIHAIGGSTMLEVPVERDEVVTAFQWSAKGLLWQTVPADTSASTAGAEPETFVLGDDLTPIPIELHAATPEASPMASPGPASPRA
ncbi:MAG TPA: hypothetical protein VGR16_14405 [Thermomicrobiales bacterium]|nr:hypothetical protein [Thermomicrobiales bacterium]